MEHGSLFSGIGGFDLAFEEEGYTTAWQVEIDRACRGVLRRRFPEAVHHVDVESVGRRNLEAVDIVTGGFPCQDVSIAGPREGLAGARSGLWFQFHRVLAELRPRWVVVENVPGLLSSNDGRDFAVILHGLVGIGYRVAWRILDAQYFGVPQRRRRVYIVGRLGDGRAAEVLFESSSGSRDPAAGREEGQGASRVTAPSLTASNNPSRSPQSNEVMGQVAAVVGAVSSKWAKRTGGPAGDEAYNLIPVTLSGGGTRPDRPEGGFYSEVDAKTAKTLDDQDGAQGGTYVVWHNKQQSGEIRVQEGTSPTVSTQWGTGGNNVPLVGVRRLTPVECERLQGFPDDWTGGQSDSARYRQLGNAVCVPVARWLARRIKEVEYAA